MSIGTRKAIAQRRLPARSPMPCKRVYPRVHAHVHVCAHVYTHDTAVERRVQLLLCATHACRHKRLQPLWEHTPIHTSARSSIDAPTRTYTRIDSHVCTHVSTQVYTRGYTCRNKVAPCSQKCSAPSADARIFKAGKLYAVSDPNGGWDK